MAVFISVVVSEEANATDWVYGQKANDMTTLESDGTYNSISKMPRDLFVGQRANNKKRFIQDNFGAGGIEVVSYKGDIHAENALLKMSAKLGKQAVKGLTTLKK